MMLMNRRRVVRVASACGILGLLLGMPVPARAECLTNVHGRAGTWCSVDGPHVRVWWRTLTAGGPSLGQPAGSGRLNADEVDARRVRDAVEQRLWPLYEGLFGRVPLGDGGRYYQDAGRDGRYDIMLIEDRTGPSGATYQVRRTSRAAPPARMSVLKRQLPVKRLLAAAAHELMRGFLSAYRCPGTSCPWLESATAAWAEDLAYPAVNTEHGYTDAFFSAPSRSLVTLNAGPADPHPSGAYLFLFFLQHRVGTPRGDPSVVRTLWEAAERTGDARSAISATFPPATLPSVWREFITRNWNDAFATTYRDWDGIQGGVSKWAASGVPGAPAKYAFDLLNGPDVTVPLAVNLPPLSAAYFGFEIDATVRQLEIRHNTMAIGPGGGEVIVLSRTGKRWTQHPKWNLENVHVFCLDAPRGRIDELMVILGNAGISGSQNFSPGGSSLSPAVIAKSGTCLPRADDGFEECRWDVPEQTRNRTTYQHSHVETWRLTQRLPSPPGNVYYSYDWTAEGGGNSDSPNSVGTWSFRLDGSGGMRVTLEPPDKQSAAARTPVKPTEIFVIEDSMTGRVTHRQAFSEWTRPKRTASDTAARIEGTSRETLPAQGMGINQVGTGTLTCRWSWPGFSPNPSPSSPTIEPHRRPEPRR